MGVEEDFHRVDNSDGIYQFFLGNGIYQLHHASRGARGPPLLTVTIAKRKK
jgi:hypothetical protein